MALGYPTETYIRSVSGTMKKSLYLLLRSPLLDDKLLGHLAVSQATSP